MAPKFSSGDNVRYKPVGGKYRLCSILNPNLSCIYQPTRGPPSPLLTRSSPPGPDSNTSESTGVIQDVITEPGMQASRHVQASAQEPRYEVRGILHAQVTAVCRLADYYEPPDPE
jgi:hypothetical protein